jgi:AcrR family transcriptional regulator
MQEKSYGEITITDILDRADVGRSTFYAHYRDKDDLMLSGYDDIRAALAAEREHADPAGELLQPVLAVFGHVAEHRAVARQATRIDGTLPPAIMGELRELTEALLREHLRQHARESIDPLALEAATQFLTGALVSLLVWWTSHDLPYSAAELDRTFRRLATQGIRRFLSSG